MVRENEGFSHHSYWRRLQGDAVLDRALVEWGKLGVRGCGHRRSHEGCESGLGGGGDWGWNAFRDQGRERCLDGVSLGGMAVGAGKGRHAAGRDHTECDVCLLHGV